MMETVENITAGTDKCLHHLQIFVLEITTIISLCLYSTLYQTIWFLVIERRNFRSKWVSVWRRKRGDCIHTSVSPGRLSFYVDNAAQHSIIVFQTTPPATTCRVGKKKKSRYWHRKGQNVINTPTGLSSAVISKTSLSRSQLVAESHGVP